MAVVEIVEYRRFKIYIQAIEQFEVTVVGPDGETHWVEKGEKDLVETFKSEIDNLYDFGQIKQEEE